MLMFPEYIIVPGNRSNRGNQSVTIKSGNAFPQYQKDISHLLDDRRNMRVKCNKEVLLYAWIRPLRSATS